MRHRINGALAVAIWILACQVIAADPEITTEPGDTSACDGDTLMLSVVAGGTPPFSYQWRKFGVVDPNDPNTLGFVPISGETQSVLDLTPASAADGGTYDVIVSNGLGSVQSALAEVNIEFVPNVVRPPIDRVVGFSESITMVVETEHDPNTYQWRRNGLAVVSGTGSDLVLPADANAAGTYDVIITNPCGSVTSPAALVTYLETPHTSRLSVSSTGIEADEDTAGISMSADGRFAVFASDAENLVSAANDGIRQIYLHDRLRRETTLISAAPDGTAGDDTSGSPHISADGQFIAFGSRATNLVPGDTNNRRDIFVFERSTGLIEAVSVDALGNLGNSNSAEAFVSSDGQYVTFVSSSTNLDASVTNGTLAVFLRDRVAGTTETISIATGGTTAFYGDGPSLTADGRFVVFRSPDGGLVAGDTNGDADIFVRDRQAGTTTRVSVTSGGAEIDGGVALAEISADGAFLVYESLSDDLSVADTNGIIDLYLYELATGAVSLVSAQLDGSAGGGARPAISSDGAYIAFASGSEQLVPNDDNLRGDTFLLDRVAGTISRVSLDNAGQPGNQDSTNSDISDDGRYVLFTSAATNLVPADQNQRTDMFVHDRYGCLAPTIVTPPALTEIFLGQAFVLTVTATGTPDLDYQWKKDGVDVPGETGTSLFVAAAEPNDAGAYSAVVSNSCGSIESANAVVAIDLCVPLLEIASCSAPGAQLISESGAPAVSANGRFVAFTTSANNIVPEGTRSYTSVVAYDRFTGDLELLSARPDATAATGGSHGPSISDDGRFVVFQSEAEDIVGDDTNGVQDVFLRDRDPDENGVYGEGNGVTVRLSVGAGAIEGDADSQDAVISGNGQFVAFRSQADNLVPGTSSGFDQIFLIDRQSGNITLASADPNGAPGDEDSFEPAISGDGNRVAYWSRAQNLIVSDGNIFPDVFLFERATGTVSLVSSDSAGGTIVAEHMRPAISADGSLVAFQSDGQFDPGDTNGLSDVFVKQISTGQVDRASVSSAELLADGGSIRPSLSGNGRYLAFHSTAGNLVPAGGNGFRQTYVRDRQAGLTWLLSETPGDSLANGDSSAPPKFAAGGDWVVFASIASDLVADDTYGLRDVFLHSLEEGLNRRVSVSDPLVSGSGLSAHASVSADGRYVVFRSSAANLVPGDDNEEHDVFLRDRLTLETRRLNVSPAGDEMPDGTVAASPVISGDGRYVFYRCGWDQLVPGDVNGRGDIVAYDRQTGETVLISVASDGTQGDDESGDGSYSIDASHDGRFVVYNSRATTLVPDDTNGDADVFLHDRDPDINGIFDEGNGVTTRVSVNSLGDEVYDSSVKPAISGDGRWITFVTDSPGLVANDTNNREDIFLHDRLTGSVTRVSVDSAGNQADDLSNWSDISFDGSVIVFDSLASNLDPADGDARWDIFEHRPASGLTQIASVSTGGSVANDTCERPFISGDGTVVVFHSYADNLDSQDTNGMADVFAHNLVTGSTVRVSVGAAGQQSDRDSRDAAVSENGNVITFATDVTDFIPLQLNRGTNIHVQDRGGCAAPTILDQPVGASAPAGSRIRLEVAATGNPPPAYQWRRNGVPIFGAQQRTWTIDDLLPATAGDYDVLVSNSEGVVSSLTATVAFDIPCPGDTDQDLDVDLTDLAQVLGQFGQTGALLAGDVDGDGDVDLSDLATVLANFGATCS